MNFRQASKKLAELKALNDGREYCMTLDPMTRKFRVAEKTQEQKNIDKMNGESANQKLVDFLHENRSSNHPKYRS